MIDAKILHTSQIIVAFSPIRAFMLDTILINENEIKDRNTIVMFIICNIYLLINIGNMILFSVLKRVRKLKMFE